MRKSILSFILCAVLLALLLPGCAASKLSAPRVMVNDRLYCAVVPEPQAALPEGYTLAGTPERVKTGPRKNMTGLNVPKGSELYVNPAAPEAVYLRVPGRDGYSLYKLDFLPPTQMPGGIA